MANDESLLSWHDEDALSLYQQEKLRLMRNILAAVKKLTPPVPPVVSDTRERYVSNIKYAPGTNISASTGIITIVEELPSDIKGLHYYRVEKVQNAGYGSVL